MLRRPPRSPLFPTRRSSDLARDRARGIWNSAYARMFFDAVATAARNPLSSCAAARASSAAGTLTLGRSSASNRSEEHTSELQSRLHLVCRLLLEKKKSSWQT